MVDAAEGRPRFCQVDGHAASTGNTVNFQLGLPESWNGKFLFLGVGGLGGSLAKLDPGLARGYATATTDTGHRASEPDWASNRAKEIDYGYRGTHVSTVATKALTASFYGTAPKYAYFEGCSNGGRQALMEVQRYPDDFDGVIGGHPATGTPMQVGRAVVYQRMLASPDAYLTPSAIELVSKASLAACDKADGLEDGLVSDPRPCRFDPSALVCRGAATDGCLTPGQVATVAQIYRGVKTPDGQIYAHGFPPGHEGGATGWTQWIAGQTPPAAQEGGSLAYTGTRLPSGYGLMDFNFQFLALENDEPGYGWRQFDVARDLPRMRTMTEILSPLDADLRPFAKSGGKLLMYHGWSDPGISALGTLDYYERVVRTVGGQSTADGFVQSLLRAGHAPLRRRPGAEHIRDAAGARVVGGEGRRARLGAGVARGRRQDGADAPALSASTGGPVSGHGQHRRGRKLRLRRAVSRCASPRSTGSPSAPGAPPGRGRPTSRPASAAGG